MSYELNQNDIYGFTSYVLADTHVKGDELIFKYCPYCDGGSHRDKDTFSINLESGAYCCLRATCGAKGHFVELCRDFGYELDFGRSAKKYKQLPQVKPKFADAAIEYLKSRGISESTAKRYYITACKDKPNVLVFPFYDQDNILQFIKYRNTKYVKGQTGGNKEWCERDTKPILFGMAQCVDFEQAVITEGQLDSLTLTECGIKNALSVPTGCKGFTWLQYCKDWLEQFRTLVVFGDYEQGRMTLLDDLKKLNLNIKAVQPMYYLGEKDANDIYCKYGKDAIIKAVDTAECIKNERIIRLADVKSVDLQSMPKIKTGIYELDRTLGGLYYGQLILLSGKRGNGKSTFMSQLIAEALEQEQAVLAYSGELPSFYFKNWLDLQIAGRTHIVKAKNEFGDDVAILPPETVDKINAWYYDKMFIYDNSVIPTGDDEQESLIEIIKKSILKYGIKLVCIDNLMTAMDCDTSTDLYRAQSVFTKQLAAIAKEYNVAIILVAHPKKGDDFTNDAVSGSSDITNAADIVMAYARKAENDQGDYDSTVVVTKNRLTGRLITKSNAIKLVYGSLTKRIQSKEHFNENKQYGCFKGSDAKSELPWEEA